jgi:CelD/BcsL family acetyltransferase involved in cellulose biosynthesis
VQIEIVQTEHRLNELRDDWDRLVEESGLRHPFVGWHWATHWWQHYGAGHDLAVGVARRHGTIVGIAPWYVERHGGRGTVCWLGSGEVCTEYVGFLTAPGQLPEFCRALLDAWGAGPACWEAIELCHMPADSPTAAAFQEIWRQLGRDLVTHRAASWQVRLPASWEAYLRQLSSNRRGEARRILQRAEAAGIRCAEVAGEDELPEAWQALVQLHQKRWTSAGEPGCFASPRFESFHRSLLVPLHRKGQIRLRVARKGGAIVAATYCLSQAGITYYYQGGYDPDSAEWKPGTLLHLHGIRQAIERGDRVYDFMVGNEEYKRRWSTEQRPLVTLRAAGDQPGARVRLRLSQLWRGAKDAVRGRLPWVRRIRNRLAPWVRPRDSWHTATPSGPMPSDPPPAGVAAGDF